ncbi:MAG: urease accessory protein UreE [Caulobacterales bacterium]
MHRVTAIVPAASAPKGALDSVRLDHDLRTRRRALYVTEAAESVMLDMPNVVRLRDGDCLRLDDGRLIRIHAALESLIEVTARDPGTFVRIAWHLGNRHLPTQFMSEANALRIRADHVIAEMVGLLGGACTSISAPFDPEGGAYESGARPQEPAGHHHHGHHHHHHS